MKTLVNWLIGYAMRTPYFHLYNPDGTPYMSRYWLIPSAPARNHDESQGCYQARWWKNPLVWLFQKFDIAVRIHHIQSADLHRDMHDHPWWFVSVVLRGWYVEELMPEKPRFPRPWTNCRMRRAGSIAVRTTRDKHTVVSVPYRGVWTLFITGPWRQVWGFYTREGWVEHSAYNARHNPANEPDVTLPPVVHGIPDNFDGRRTLRRVKA